MILQCGEVASLTWRCVNITTPKLVERCFRYPDFGQFVGHDSFQAARRDRRSCGRPGLGCTGRAGRGRSGSAIRIRRPLLHAIHRRRVFGQFGDAERGVAQRDQLPTVPSGRTAKAATIHALRRVRGLRVHQRGVDLATVFGCDRPSNWRSPSICILRLAGNSRSISNDARSFLPISWTIARLCE